jgi:hypothetical protein
MFHGIIDNAGTILVSLALIGLVAWIVAGLRKNKKQGKSSCGCNCGSCPMSGSCHKQV